MKLDKELNFILRFKANILCLGGLLALYFVWKSSYIPLSIKWHPASIWLVLVLCVLCITSRAKWLYAFVALAWLFWIAWTVNRIKIKSLDFPVTEQDIIMAASNLKHVFDAVGVLKIQQSILLILGALLLIAGIIFCFRNKPVQFKQCFLLKNLVPFCSMLLLTTLIFKSFYFEYGRYIYNNKDKIFEGEPLSMNHCISSISKRLWVLGFLSYSSYTVKQDRADLESYILESTNSEKENIEAILKSASRFISNVPAESVAPNIVFMFAESTFDPDSLLLLDKKIGNSLFNQGEEGSNRVGGFLHVNIFGGSSWVTEFETVTGIDSRFFGFLGKYTHSSLSPYIKKSFATHLRERYGYFTEVFYPVLGEFFGARRGYKNCGFDKFRDPRELGFTLHWDEFSDEVMSDKVILELPDDLPNPFFSYVVLLENHGPHPCKNFTESSQFSVRYASDSSFEGNCALNEYVKRSRSTEAAFKKTLKRLQEIENKTGRPFIIVIFGDHQISFTGTDNEKNRNKAMPSRYHTFYLIEASKSIKLPKIKGALHTTFLPTIVSAIIAKDYEDIYMPENLYIFEKCGDVADLKNCKEHLHHLARAYKNYITLK